MAWRKDTLGRPESYRVFLSEQEATEISEAVSQLDRTGRLAAIASLARSDFVLSAALEQRLEDASHAVRDGPGFVLLKGLPTAGSTIQRFTGAVWAVGSRFGDALSQNAQGERITEVIDATAQDDTPRMYRSNLELRPHNDVTAMVALGCWQPSLSGGATVLTSALTVHDEIERRSPELLEVLRRGFFYHRLGEQGPQEEPVSPWRIPVFARRNGQLSCRYQRAGIAAGHRELGQPLSETEIAALDLFDSIAKSPGNCLPLRLESGDMLIVNNYTVLHARTAFTDEAQPERKRLLVRLWLDAAGFRDVPPEMRLFQVNGIPPQEGRRCTYDFRRLYAEDPRASGGVPGIEPRSNTGQH